MIQLSSTASTCAAQWKMWLNKVFSVIYLTAVCAAQDPQDVTAVVGDISPTVISTIYVPPVPSLQLQSAWEDVFPSEKVEFSCSITGSSDWDFTWYRSGQLVQDSRPNVLTNGSMLTVTAATQIYSGNYFCKGQHKTKGITTAASNSIKLTVNANKPKPTLSRSSNFGMFPGESVTFTCKVNVSRGWEYLWYHNGTIQPPNNNTYTINSVKHSNNGEYHCKAKRGKGPFDTEESEKTSLQVSDPPTPSLKLESRWPDVFENEILEFSCEVVGSSDWTFTWYQNQKKLQEDFIPSLDAEEALLNITSVNLTHEGGYACKAHHKFRGVTSGFSNTVNVKVYEKIPKPTFSNDPGFNPMYVGETVKFTCKVDVSSGWEYEWYKDGHYLPAASETHHEIHLGPSDGGIYWCKATRGKTTSTDDSEKIPQGVLEIPLPSLKLITPWLDVFPTESVKMSCGMNGSSGWTYTWYKEGQKVQADNVVSFDSNGATLSINSASAAHAGRYKCNGHLKDRSVSSSFSPELTLIVYDKKTTVILTQDPDYKVMFPGESVSFSCHINVSSGWEYLWYKDGSTLPVSGNRHTISSVARSDTGSYKCQTKRGRNTVFHLEQSHAIRLEVEENTPKPLMTQQPDVNKVYTGESVSFKCKVNLSSGWGYIWYKDGASLPINSSSFNIHDANEYHSGSYTCMATRDKTKYNTKHSDEWILHVSEIPVPFLKLTTPWLDVFPTESVKMSCGMYGSSDWTYTWYKGGQKVQADNTIVSLDSDGTTLSISSASASQRGQYNCSGKLKSRSVSTSISSGLTLDVYDTKPRVILMQNPKHNVMHTGDSVSFSCHINVSFGWEYLWYKDGSTLPVSGNNHTITSVARSDTGSYKCQAKRGRNTVFHSDQSQDVTLDIKERPQANIILLTGWSEVFSTDSLVLRCGVQESQDMWNYTWFKENKQIDLEPSEKHTVTPQDNHEQSGYTCQGIRTGRPSYSKRSDPFNTKNLLLKRRVLLSISGCLFFGIIAVFLGCIVLKVIRKPADDEDKPEEGNLFLTMAQLKNCTDAPCPLVDYITDEALNASSKEGDENGTICSETTPLPITSQDDQAATTESHDDENNGGLVSFKQ